MLKNRRHRANALSRVLTLLSPTNRTQGDTRRDRCEKTIWLLLAVKRTDTARGSLLRKNRGRYLSKEMLYEKSVNISLLELFLIKRITVDDDALYFVKVDDDAVAAEVPSHFLCGRVLEMRRFVENAAVVSPAFAALIDENIINASVVHDYL